jgi:hypothetical protein
MTLGGSQIDLHQSLARPYQSTLKVFLHPKTAIFRYETEDIQCTIASWPSARRLMKSWMEEHGMLAQ